ncbi:MAG TPA: hypothetical protein VF875_18640, partial [Anaeromyxobacter sp.]
GQDPAFLAGTIAYMACSCQLHRAYEAEFPGRRVPRDIYFGSAAQERCEEAYFECLIALLGKGSETGERVDGLEVYGREEFRRAVTNALRLLRDKKLPAWDTLTQHVSSIIEGTRTDAIVTAHPAFMFVDGPHSGQDPAFLAGTIAHMACSCQLHRNYEAEFPGRRVPRDIYSGNAAQERCEKAYQECLLALGKG